MYTKRTTIIGGGILSLSLIAGLAFLFWQRSENNSIQYQSSKQFDTTPVSPEENLSPEEKPETASAVPSPEAVKKETKEESAPPKETEKEEEAVKGFTLKSKLVSFGHESASGRTINTIVLHSSHAVSGDPYDVDAVIALWKSYSVAPHYMIARNGTVYQLVSDKNIAYHAGDSKMSDGRTGVNNFSIGVEILNTKTDKYTSAQYQATKDLISALEKKYGNLKVVGHDTIAPGRKTDPWNFDWGKL